MYDVIPREEWGAGPGFGSKELIPPVGKVRFVFATQTGECHSKEGCCAVLRSLQQHHQIKSHLPDINFNFLVGGDGNVYEGRGYRIKITRLPTHDDADVTNWLTIGYLGNFNEKEIPDVMIRAGRLFLKKSIQDKFLSSTVLSIHKNIKLSPYL